MQCRRARFAAVATATANLFREYFEGDEDIVASEPAPKRDLYANDTFPTPPMRWQHLSPSPTSVCAN
eukprot:4898277-Pleurochrysis_carterae.AAC.4